MASRDSSQVHEQETQEPCLPVTPTLCINNCGFYGTPQNNYLCSLCFKKLSSVASPDRSSPSPDQRPDTPSSSSFDGVSASLGGLSLSPSSSALLLPPTGSSVDTQAPETTDASSSSTCLPPVSTSSTSALPPKPTRCFSCRRRVGLTGFKCRCGDVFCSSHRYSDQHNCSFDYKARAKEEIAAQNPVVKADKITKI